LNIQSPIGWPRKTVTVGFATSLSAAGSGEAAGDGVAQGIGKFSDHDPCSAVVKTTTATPEAITKTTKTRLRKKRITPLSAGHEKARPVL
jgi:hypothetical protein